MSEISIVPIEDGKFGVHIADGRTVTSHRVIVPAGFADDLSLDAEPADIVHQSMRFLLERQEHTSIRGEFSVVDLDHQFDDYRSAIQARFHRSRSRPET